MIIKLKENDYEKFDLPKIIQREGFEVEEINSNRWAVNINGKEIIISKGKDMFNFLGIEWKDFSSKPQYSFIDVDNKRVTLVVKRSQEQSGSTDQKIPYSGFMRKNYNDIYRYETDYYFIAAISINAHFSEEKYSYLLNYVSGDQSVEIWKEEIKIG